MDVPTAIPVDAVHFMLPNSVLVPYLKIIIHYGDDDDDCVCVQEFQ